MTMSMTSLKNEVQYIRNSQSKSVRGGPAQKRDGVRVDRARVKRGVSEWRVSQERG